MNINIYKQQFKNFLKDKFNFLFITFLFALSISLPLVYSFFINIEIVNYYEESIGYRYFYSLRVLYGNEFPWLPQGQFPNIFYILTQSLLTLFGNGIDEIFPRIIYFSQISATIPILLSIFVFYYLGEFLKNNNLLAVIGLLFILSIYNFRVEVLWMLLPEYVFWIVPISILSLILVIRLLSDENFNLNNVRTGGILLFSLFSATVISTKLTYSIFLIPIICLILSRSQISNINIKKLVLYLIVTVFIFIIIILANSNFNISYIYKYVSNFIVFAKSQKNTLGPIAEKELWMILAPNSLLDPIIFVILLPVLILNLCFIAYRKILPILMISSLLSLLFYCSRPYHVSIFEVMVNVAYNLSIIIILYFDNITNIFEKNYLYKKNILIISMIFLFISSFDFMLNLIETTIKYSNIHSILYKKLHFIINENNSSTALVAIDNNYRIPTIDSGFCKGGMEIFNMNWNETRYLARLFPNTDCYYFVKQHINIEKYNFIVFVSIGNESMEISKNKIQGFYNLLLNSFDCNYMLLPFYAGNIHVCKRS